MKLLVKFFFFKHFKKILIGLSSSGGRNILGRICVYHQGGGNKRRFKLIDRFRRVNQYGYIFKILSDKIQTAFIGMILYVNGLVSFITLSDGVIIGSKIFSGYILNSKNVFKNGSAVLLKDINLFSVINSVEIFPFSGFKIARAAGSSAYIVGKENNKVILKLNSG
jgi:large subunit ribosomal protein L2